MDVLSKILLKLLLMVLHFHLDSISFTGFHLFCQVCVTSETAARICLDTYPSVQLSYFCGWVAYLNAYRLVCL